MDMIILYIVILLSYVVGGRKRCKDSINLYRKYYIQIEVLYTNIVPDDPSYACIEDTIGGTTLLLSTKEDTGRMLLVRRYNA